MAGYNEKRLLHDLLDSYNILERPVVNESDPLQLSFGLTLMQIIDVDEKNQLLVTNIWLKLVSTIDNVWLPGSSESKRGRMKSIDANSFPFWMFE
uniref:Neurotransmitter-gated ion-channel ligand-binding domain-containing protein n=1 Tax=Anopheles christyi TaxID=43041 RepID=A0A182KIK8_9DIPT